eukprot:NODE_150_length_2495_cov_91.413851_g146_i0.p1 GENE.NODE_150_length_2495_cov_91.413851_g146_i0~~NODE_150_length_2495_cov_91.413851_g146_i0.p1  ORF type:complete len:815 (+),score=199.73 NODE_150_length_2495_cov_91.413851_g146_i0:56-2446(+)
MRCGGVEVEQRRALVNGRIHAATIMRFAKSCYSMQLRWAKVLRALEGVFAVQHQQLWDEAVAGRPAIEAEWQSSADLMHQMMHAEELHLWNVITEFAERKKKLQRSEEEEREMLEKQEELMFRELLDDHMVDFGSCILQVAEPRIRKDINEEQETQWEWLLYVFVRDKFFAAMRELERMEDDQRLFMEDLEDFHRFCWEDAMNINVEEDVQRIELMHRIGVISAVIKERVSTFQYRKQLRMQALQRNNPEAFDRKMKQMKELIQQEKSAQMKQPWIGAKESVRRQATSAVVRSKGGDPISMSPFLDDANKKLAAQRKADKMLRQNARASRATGTRASSRTAHDFDSPRASIGSPGRSPMLSSRGDLLSPHSSVRGSSVVGNSRSMDYLYSPDGIPTPRSRAAPKSSRGAAEENLAISPAGFASPSPSYHYPSLIGVEASALVDDDWVPSDPINEHTVKIHGTRATVNVSSAQIPGLREAVWMSKDERERTKDCERLEALRTMHAKAWSGPLEPPCSPRLSVGFEQHCPVTQSTAKKRPMASTEPPAALKEHLSPRQDSMSWTETLQPAALARAHQDVLGVEENRDQLKQGILIETARMELAKLLTELHDRGHYNGKWRHRQNIHTADDVQMAEKALYNASLQYALELRPQLVKLHTFCQRYRVQHLNSYTGHWKPVEGTCARLLCDYPPSEECFEMLTEMARLRAAITGHKAQMVKVLRQARDLGAPTAHVTDDSTYLQVRKQLDKLLGDDYLLCSSCSAPMGSLDKVGDNLWLHAVGDGGRVCTLCVPSSKGKSA